MANKYQLETIPVWDGIQSDSECFICDLMKEALDDSLRFFLGSSVMNPETRVRVNSTGFCPEHTAMLVESGHPNSMAVLWETHLEKTRDELSKTFRDMENGKNPKKILASMDAILGEREQGCLICQKMKDRLDRYCFTLPYLWGQDQEFRKAFSQSKGFCLHHTAHILRMSIEALDAKQQKEFAASLAELQQRNLDRIAKDLVYMIEHYKSENIRKPWNGCEDAQVRAVYKEIGKGRTIR
ncbi:MAG: hypothetical protein IKP61_08230 [Spirochaetales bacterium]|nr:hypothetical protein [Spirochaetales bacterium]